jgi:hypothetical protein
MSSEAPAVEAKAKQREKAKRATFDMLIGKKPNSEEFTVPFGPDGQQVSFLFVAIGSADYDQLLTDHPPTTEQRASGATFNINSFGPALLALVSREPALSVGNWTELWTSPAWGRGELMGLFWRAANLCTKEVDPTPIAAG